MLHVQSLTKHFGVSTILDNVSFVLNDGEHIGLIGPNGAGKSTLLKLITGEMTPDGGTIIRSPRDLSLGYLPQGWTDDTRTVADVLTGAQHDVAVAEHALQAAADALATATNIDAAMVAYDQALARWEALGGYEREHRAQAVLAHLALETIAPAMPVARLSGGQKTRLGLATLLLREPDLLLLDEPTNHLDVDALAWLEAFVRAYRGAVLVVSHDRTFLDHTVDRILYLDPTTHTLTSYAGNYSDFAAARQHERALHAEAYRKQQDYIERVETDIARLKGQALGVELSTTPAQPVVRRYAKKVAKKAKARERKLERYLESDERVEKPKQQWNIKLDFGPPPPGGRAVLRMDDVGFAYPDQPLLFGHATFDVQYAERAAIVGPNGAGKSTLLKLIAGQLQPRTGSVRVGTNVRLGVLAQEHETLNLHQTVLDAVLGTRPMTQTEARNFLHFFLFGGDSVYRTVNQCSLGERSRLQLALLVLQGCNLLLLDEPLNHLDIEGREHFEQALEAFDGTVIAVAHDRAFLHGFAERIVEVRDGGVRVFEGTYDAYEHTANAK